MAFQMICAAAGAVHDFAWLGALLWRPGAPKNVPVRFGAMPGHRRHLVTILWWLCGYSIAFHSGDNKVRAGHFLGKLDWKFLHGVRSNPNTDYAAWVSHNVFSMYQLMFAIITPR